MVYIVSSNISDLGEGVNTTGINDPSRYNNMLSSTFEVKPRSEIAVESVKINRNGAVQLSSANNQFNVFIGDDLNASDLRMDQSQGFPVQTWIRSPDIENKTFTLSPQDLSKKIEYGLRAGLDQHPNFSPTFNGSNTDFPKVNLLNSSGTFTGFKYLFNQNGCLSESTRTPATSIHGQKGWVNTSIFDFNSSVSTNASGIAIKKLDDGDSPFGDCSVIYQATPMSLANGSVVFYYNSTTNGSAGDIWEVGLTRATLNEQQTDESLIGEAGGISGAPPYYLDPSPVRYQNSKRFFDYSVADRGDGKLRVYQACLCNRVQNGVSSDSGFGRYEIPYGSGTPKTAKDFVGIKFIAEGDELRIFALDASGNGSLLADGISSTDKLKSTKPITIVNFHMFPKVNIYDEGSASRVMTVGGYDGVNVKTTNFYSDVSVSYQYGGRYHTPTTSANTDSGDVINGHLTYQDWWSWGLQSGNISLCRDVEFRDIVDYTREDDGTAEFDNKKTTYRKLNASGGLDLYTTLITAPDMLFSDSGNNVAETRLASSQNVMGFELSSTQTAKSYYTSASGNEVFINSNSTPKMVSNQSLFVRLPDLPIETYNTGKGSLSKILYHLPRFDNSGNEVGGLFFQPADRLYIPLENPNTIRLNNLKVEICNSNETNDQVDLVGQTVICFDIRQRNGR